jgi:phosphoglycolate phosphatase
VPVIFDLDGTLVDPAGGITGGIALSLKETGLPVPGQAQLDAMVGPKLRDALLNIAQVPAEQLDAVIARYRAHYRATGISQSRLYPGIRELLEAFVGEGRALAVATQKPEGLARTVLEHHGIAGCFQSIRGAAADESGVAPAGKADIVAAALADLGCGSAVMVGDRAQDVDGAIANGLDCVGVAWGFAPEGELEAAGAAAVVENTAELVAALEQLEALREDALSEVRSNGVV